VGERSTAELFRAAAAEAGKVEAMSDPYVTAAYRQHLARVLTFRALAAATGEGIEGRAA
jgi:carbon-monoxide dehydrogenase medium subunit